MNDLYFLDSGRMLTGLSIAPTPVWEDWRPTLQRAMTSDGESRVVAVGPSLPGAAPLESVSSTAAAVVMVLAAIPVVTTEAVLEVTLAAPLPPTMAEEVREVGLLASPGGGPHGSPSRSELEVLGGDAIGPEPERLPMAREIMVVEIPSDGEAGDEVEPPTPSQELAMVGSSAGPSSGLRATDLVWPCTEDPRKVRFILRDEQECQLRDVLGGEDLRWSPISPKPR